MFIVFDRENEARLFRESRSQGIVEKGKRDPRTGVGCS